MVVYTTLSETPNLSYIIMCAVYPLSQTPTLSYIIMHVVYATIPTRNLSYISMGFVYTTLFQTRINSILNHSKARLTISEDMVHRLSISRCIHHPYLP